MLLHKRQLANDAFMHKCVNRRNFFNLLDEPKEFYDVTAVHKTSNLVVHVPAAAHCVFTLLLDIFIQKFLLSLSKSIVAMIERDENDECIKIDNAYKQIQKQFYVDGDYEVFEQCRNKCPELYKQHLLTKCKKSKLTIFKACNKLAISNNLTAINVLILIFQMLDQIKSIVKQSNAGIIDINCKTCTVQICIKYLDLLHWDQVMLINLYKTPARAFYGNRADISHLHCYSVPDQVVSISL